ncbi:MAG: glycosyltransferase family 2 protein [Candidatus Sungbacteria bacterium]|nr:glycosyltransferase family 2 protein [Candidatus Sungbacteria bacterium]
MENTQKLVSIGLPVYNGARYMKRALDSLLAQTYLNFELIIADDASSDETPAIAAEYAKKDPRVRVVRREKQGGAGANFRSVVFEARGEYFMWAADDDWWEQKFIETLVLALEEHPVYRIAMSSFERIDMEGTIAGTVVFAGDYDITAWNERAMLRNMMRWDTPFHYILYGLFERKFLARLFSRPFPKCVAPDRVFMSEAALAARIYGTPDVLWHKTVKRKKILERFQKDAFGKAMRSRYRRSRTITAMIGRLVTSPNASFLQKITILPTEIPLFLWNNRGFVLHEFFPRIYEFLFRAKRKYHIPL